MKAGMVWVPLLSLLTGLAFAEGGDGQVDNNRGHAWGHDYQGVSAAEIDHGHAWGHDHHASVSAPEIDPGQAMGALVLLGGTLAIIRGYRRKK